ncbi:hypothetical protein OROHE_021732 [Orobanche hederae]
MDHLGEYYEPNVRERSQNCSVNARFVFGSIKSEQ